MISYNSLPTELLFSIFSFLHSHQVKTYRFQRYNKRLESLYNLTLTSKRFAQVFQPLMYGEIMEVRSLAGFDSMVYGRRSVFERQNVDTEIVPELKELVWNGHWVESQELEKRRDNLKTVEILTVDGKGCGTWASWGMEDLSILSIFPNLKSLVVLGRVGPITTFLDLPKISSIRITRDLVILLDELYSSSDTNQHLVLDPGLPQMYGLQRSDNSLFDYLNATALTVEALFLPLDAFTFLEIDPTDAEDALRISRTLVQVNYSELTNLPKHIKFAQVTDSNTPPPPSFFAFLDNHTSNPNSSSLQTLYLDPSIRSHYRFESRTGSLLAKGLNLRYEEVWSSSLESRIAPSFVVDAKNREMERKEKEEREKEGKGPKKE